jgi:uncharacterized protein (TIGR04222 family)
LYTTALVVSASGGAIYRARKTDNGSGCADHPLHIELDPFEIAYLRGGQSAVVDAAIASLVQSKVIELRPDSLFVHQEMTHEGHPVTDELRKQLSDSIGEKDMRTTAQSWRTQTLFALENIKRKLEKNGFVVSEDTASATAAVTALIALSPVAIGIPKALIGASGGRPTSLLAVLIILTFFVALMFLLKRIHRTTRGDAALAELEKNHAALKTNATHNPDGLSPIQISTAAALFGPTIFAFGIINDYYRRIAPPSSGGSGCGGGGGGCGGGGCGGGCGGCGG